MQKGRENYLIISHISNVESPVKFVSTEVIDFNKDWVENKKAAPCEAASTLCVGHFSANLKHPDGRLVPIIRHHPHLHALPGRVQRAVPLMLQTSPLRGGRANGRILRASTDPSSRRTSASPRSASTAASRAVKDAGWEVAPEAVPTEFLDMCSYNSSQPFFLNARFLRSTRPRRHFRPSLSS
jgi:hypothetical protein